MFFNQPWEDTDTLEKIFNQSVSQPVSQSLCTYVLNHYWVLSTYVCLDNKGKIRSEKWPLPVRDYYMADKEPSSVSGTAFSVH
jgi:hypothetical protein